MKTFLLFLILCLAGTKPFAQYVADESFAIQYMGYGRGFHTVTFTSLKDCAAEVRANWKQGGLVKDTVLPVAARATWVFQFPSQEQSFELKVKSDAPCSSHGWLTLTAGRLLGMPVTVHFFSATVRGNNSVLLTFRTEITGGDWFDIERSSGRGKWIAIATIKDGERTAWIDDAAPAGPNYYRLKLYNAGRVEYSKTAVVRLQEREPIRAQLLDRSGAYLGEITTRNYEQELRSRPPGVYFLRAPGYSRKVSTQR